MKSSPLPGGTHHSNVQAMKLALFGGTFDPPHLGHLMIAQEAQEACDLDKVVFIPNYQSPLKPNRPVASEAQRLEMLRLATRELPWAEVSAWEIERGGKSYSWETAEHFAKLFPETQLFWLMGVDQWNDLDLWARPERLAELLTFIVFPRNDLCPSPKIKFNSVFLTKVFPGSSTQIRQSIKTHESMLPLNLREYVCKEGLYQHAV